MKSRMQNLLNTAYECAAEFSQTFSGSLDPRVYMTLVEEELAEVSEAFNGDDEAHKLKELSDLLLVVVALDQLSTAVPAFADQETKDRMRRIGTMTEMLGDTFEGHFDTPVVIEALKRVHASNMSKLGDDGKPIYREDGKVLKGPNYAEPDLSDLV